MSYRDDIVNVALSQLGYTEGANNDTIYGDWYGLPNQPWCAMFVSWCADQANISQDIIRKFASCTTGFNWFTGEGETTREHCVPQKGDIIFFIWSKGESTPDHVGLVERVENGRVYTIEGNRSDKVQQFSYDLNDWQIYGYAFPAYEDEPPTPPIPPTPTFRTLYKGCQGDDVVYLQDKLQEKGYALPRYGSDGYYGSETEQAVRELQADAGIGVDGICGEQTWEIIESEFVRPDTPEYPRLLNRIWRCWRRCSKNTRKTL